MEMKLHCFLCNPCHRPYLEYIKAPVENFHLYLLLMKIHATLMHGDIILFP